MTGNELLKLLIDADTLLALIRQELSEYALDASSGEVDCIRVELLALRRKVEKEFE